MSSKVDLKLDWCSYKAAKFAVERWHYSKRMPTAQLAKLGVWENENFIGVVIYGVGSGNSTDGSKYNLSKRFQVAELVRVALFHHTTPTSKIVSISIKLIKREFCKLRLLTSFADTNVGHVGTIYQACGWVFVGAKTFKDSFMIHGKGTHTRTVGARGWKQSEEWLKKNIDKSAYRINKKPKNHYLYPLDKQMRKQIEPLSKPYPKRLTSIGSDAPGDPAGNEGGASPTVRL